MSGIDPCGELVLDKLWLPLWFEYVLPPMELDNGEETRPRSTPLPFRLTRPNASAVVRICSSFSCFSKCACSSFRRSASSCLSISSSSELVLPSDDDGVGGRNGRAERKAGPPCSVSVEEDEVRLGRGELAPRELRRARIPRGVELRPAEPDRRMLPAILLAARPATVCGDPSTKGNSSLPAEGDVDGVAMPGILLSPLSSSWNRAWTRYSRYGRGTSRRSASDFPAPSQSLKGL